MTSRVLAALLALALSAAPALAAVCGVDCSGVPVSPTNGDGAHARGSARHGDMNHEAPPDPAPHDCHHARGSGLIDAIGAEPQSCTHLRIESAPAKPAPPTDAPRTLRSAVAGVALPVPWLTLHSVARPATRGAADRSAASPARILPLRI